MTPVALPKGWLWVALKDVAAPIPNAIVDGPFGSNLKLTDYSESGVPVLQGKNITDDTFRWLDIRYISTSKASELRRSSVRPGDILIVKIGSIGYSAIVPELRSHEFAIIPANLAKVTPNKGRVDTQYLHHWLKTPDSKTYLTGAASKTAQPALSLGKIKELPVPLPPLEEQHRIAAILNQAEVLRARRRETVAQLDQLPRSVFVETFGEPSTNPKGWKIGPLEGLLAHPLRNGISPSKSGSVIAKVLTLSAITGKDFKSGAWKQATFQVEPPTNQRVSDEDFLICRGNGNLGLVGKGYFPSQSMSDTAFPDTMIAARLCVDRAVPAFIETLWNGAFVRRQIESLARTTNGTFKVNQSMLESIQLPLPPLLLQRRFAAEVDALHQMKATQLSSLAKMDQLFASLQQCVFRGQL